MFLDFDINHDALVQYLPEIERQDASLFKSPLLRKKAVQIVTRDYSFEQGDVT